MALPFLESGTQRLDEIVRQGVLCAFDFDGTLAPIVSQPARASLPAPVLRRLKTLSAYAPIAIITGRSVNDIKSRLAFTPDFVIGNHGIEGLPGGEKAAEEYSALCTQWEQVLVAALNKDSSRDYGISIENKTYSLSVHYRLAHNRELAQKQLLDIFASELPLAHVATGKCVFNLLPPDAPNKGHALARLCELTNAKSAIYVGDDVTDEDVFRLHRRDWLTVRVERSDDSKADYFLHHRLDIVRLLDETIARLASCQPIERTSIR